MPKTKTLRLVLGDQLDERHSWFEKPEPNVTYVMMEIRQETDYVKHHIQKVAAFFAAMRAFRDRLTQMGHKVVYIHLDDRNNQQTVPGNLEYLRSAHTFDRVEYLRPDEYRLDEQLGKLEKMLRIPVWALDTEHFLTERQELSQFFSGKKRYLMESFYRSMRRKYNILMDDKKPAGGQWNYDTQNRKPAKSGRKIPVDYRCKPDDITKQVIKLVDNTFTEHFGDLEPFHLAVTRPVQPRLRASR